MDKRFKSQLVKVARQLQGSGTATCLKRNKSSARQNAGKRKTASLTEWRADFSAARMALKEGGYKGSLVLKKGMPMYMKIQELRHARAALPSAYMSSGSGATAAQAC